MLIVHVHRTHYMVPCQSRKEIMRVNNLNIRAQFFFGNCPFSLCTAPSGYTVTGDPSLSSIMSSSESAGQGVQLVQYRHLDRAQDHILSL